jgi:hypothetical protein
MIPDRKTGARARTNDLKRIYRRAGDASTTVIGSAIVAAWRPEKLVRGEDITMRSEDGVPQGTREIILGASPARFFIPPYFGAKGWIGVGLDEAADWREVEAFVHRSYRLVAPKRLAKLVA